MFRIRFFTPCVQDEQGWPHAGGELLLGTERVAFVVDLKHWGMTDYERQWQAGIARLAHGAPSTALMTAYRGPDSEEPHLMYALWRDDSQVYAQQLSVLPAELQVPFDPFTPYNHVGERVPVSEEGLPIVELRCDLLALLAAHFFPSFPWRSIGGEWGTAA